MKIEKCVKHLSLWRSVLAGIVVLSVSFMLMMVFAGLINAFGGNPYFFIDVSMTIIIVLSILVVVGHFIYYNFDIDFLRICVVCGAHEYSKYMNVLQDSETLEHVCYCKKHRFSTRTD